MKDSCLPAVVCLLVTLFVGMFSCCVPAQNTRATVVTVASDRVDFQTALHLIKATVKVQKPDGGSGSGIVIWSGKNPVDKKFHTFVVTCAHVMSGAPMAFCEQPLYVNNHNIEGQITHLSRTVLFNPNDDLALLEIISEEQHLKDVVSLATDAEYEALTIAQPIVVVGCGGGRPPYITYGQISHFNIDKFLHATSPIFGGNSGGGAFTLSGRLIGIADRTMAIRGRVAPPESGLEPIVIPISHAACFVPAPDVARWLRAAGYAFIVDPSVSYESFAQSKEKVFR